MSGRKDRVSDSLREIKALEEKTSQNTGITHIAFNYGGRAEIVDAVNRLLQEKRKVSPKKIFLLIYIKIYRIRNSLSERAESFLRISNFLLWQLAYAEIYVTDTLWLDFEERDLELALENFQKRERRFWRSL